MSYDYGFLSAKYEQDVKSGKKALSEVTRLFIGKDSKSKALLAHATPHKGINQTT